MSRITKLVIYPSDGELDRHAAGYPCLVNYNPFMRTGELDDGCGHFAAITFVAIDPEDPTPSLPEGEFDNVEFIQFPMPAGFKRGTTGSRE